MIFVRAAKKDECWKLQILNDEVFIDNAKYDSDLILDWATSDKGKKYFKKILLDKSALVLLAQENDKLIGYLTGRQKNLGYRKSKCIEIENMGVTSKYRSKGVGSRLINECISWAKKQGYKKVYVNSYFKNIQAISFYKRNGFNEIDISLEKDI